MRTTGPIRAIVLLALSASAAGCSAVGAISHSIFGSPPIDAQYKPLKQSTLVLVENYQAMDGAQLDDDVVARELGQQLHEHADLDVVDPDKLLPLREEDAAAFRAMPIPAVGRAMGAKQVVYVDLVETDAGSDPTGGAVHATCTARVRVVEADTGKVLWPAGQPRGAELTAKVEYDRYDAPGAATTRSRMLSQLSDSIAKLFYRWQPDTERDPEAPIGA